MRVAVPPLYLRLVSSDPPEDIGILEASRYTESKRPSAARVSNECGGAREIYFCEEIYRIKGTNSVEDDYLEIEIGGTIQMLILTLTIVGLRHRFEIQG